MSEPTAPYGPVFRDQWLSELRVEPAGIPRPSHAATIARLEQEVARKDADSLHMHDLPSRASRRDGRGHAFPHSPVSPIATGLGILLRDLRQQALSAPYQSPACLHEQQYTWPAWELVRVTSPNPLRVVVGGGADG